jgi:hypothetical protein
MLRVDDAPNYLFLNQTVSAATRVTPGCFVDLGDGRRSYLRHGRSAITRTPGAVTATRFECQDNELTRKAISVEPSRVPFRCARSGSNAGCSRAVSCPAGKKLIAIRAACGLESASIAAGAVSATPWDVLRVVRRSDRTSDGACAVAGKRISEGEAALPPQLGEAAGFDIFCAERDKNGGDCVVQGEALCL